MRTVFADTGFFIALVNPKDALHDKAVRLRLDLRPVHVITTQMVLTEFLNDFGARGSIFRQSAMRFVEQCYKSAITKRPALTIVAQTPPQFDAAFSLYRDRPDKAWSLTDCASYLVMQECGIHEAPTRDHHFEQMGFRALLRNA